ncbi:MAG: DNA recombination protein RmuC [Pseudomonadota bacterium]
MSALSSFGLDLSDPVHQVLLAVLALGLGLGALVGQAARRAGRESAALRRDLTALHQAQAESKGAHALATQAIDARMTGLSAELGDGLAQSATQTAQTLGALQERLAAIDLAQRNIEKLSGDVLGLQDILSNKQTRGAFGEIQLHDLLSKALPPNAYRWQATLANGTRADCILDLPDPPGAIVIDAKFPLEPYDALVAAHSNSERKVAARAFRTAIRSHIRAISEKYIQPGETADSALLFLPSEAVYAELHSRFPDLVREGFAARVWTVSPTTCMALLNTLRAVLKDARMRDEAQAIRTALRLLHRDIALVEERAGRLKSHLAQAQGDLDGITIAATRAAQRMDRLDDLDFDDASGLSRPDAAPEERDASRRDVRIYRR